jgi:GNAT superfamily N-acetyltransferase
MSASSAVSRVVNYVHRHGLAATLRRARLGLWRAFFAGRKVVFYCDLNNQDTVPLNLTNTFQVQRFAELSDLSPLHLGMITSFWNFKIANRNLRERFEKGAVLWLALCKDQLAGYGWTLRGRTIEPYFFPLAKDDVHLFDFHVFPDYRGRGVNPYLVNHILDRLAKDAAGRAFIETAEWNYQQLSSLRKTRFRYLGMVSSLRLFGHSFVSWKRNRATAEEQKSAVVTFQSTNADAIACPNSPENQLYRQPERR